MLCEQGALRPDDAYRQGDRRASARSALPPPIAFSHIRRGRRLGRTYGGQRRRSRTFALDQPRRSPFQRSPGACSRPSDTHLTPICPPRAPSATFPFAGRFGRDSRFAPFAGSLFSAVRSRSWEFSRVRVLSRRRSRVRVPSLPLLTKVPGNRRFSWFSLGSWA